MQYSYYRVQQELAKMIVASLAANPSIKQASEISHQVGVLLLHAEKPFMKDLYEAGYRFERWLDDTDIRVRDPAYDKQLTDEIRSWAEASLHKTTDS